MLRNLGKMCASVSRHEVAVQGRPTEVLCLGQSLGEQPENLILIIPGNPGVASYYTSTMQTLYSRLGGSHSVWVVSHAAHCLSSCPSPTPGTQHVYDLEEQVAHKVAFVQDHLPKGTKLTLAGHSIGCYIILRLLKHFEANSGVEIARSFLLFPTIERMKGTPNGRRVWLLLCYLRWLVVLLTFCASLLPEKLKDTFLGWYFGGSVAPCCLGATKELLHTQVVQNMLWMAYNELRYVVEPDLDTIRKHKDRILFYYGATDGWCPQQYREDLREQVEGVEALLCEDGSDHAFVLRHSEQVAEKLAEWIAS